MVVLVAEGGGGGLAGHGGGVGEGRVAGRVGYRMVLFGGGDARDGGVLAVVRSVGRCGGQLRGAGVTGLSVSHVRASYWHSGW